MAPRDLSAWRRSGDRAPHPAAPAARERAGADRRRRTAGLRRRAGKVSVDAACPRRRTGMGAGQTDARAQFEHGESARAVSRSRRRPRRRCARRRVVASVRRRRSAGASPRLCGDLARVTDTRSLPGLLERTATLIDASGIVLWIADPDGRELAPIVTFGYPQQTVTRLGTIAAGGGKRDRGRVSHLPCCRPSMPTRCPAARSPRRSLRRQGASA